MHPHFLSYSLLDTHALWLPHNVNGYSFSLKVHVQTLPHFDVTKAQVCGKLLEDRTTLRMKEEWGWRLERDQWLRVLLALA